MKRLVVIVVVAMMVVAAVGLVQPALADGGGQFNSTDGRISPTTADRLAVYCHDSSVDVYGIDPLQSGHYLTTYSFAELTSGKNVVHNVSLGEVSLNLDAMPQTHFGFPILEATTPSIITDVGTQYHVTWTGGTWGADGSTPFVKTFSCTYLPMVGQ
jgi:hypothetical protein